MRELELPELSPETLLPRLNAKFLESQPDTWLVRLYEYLNKVPAVAARLKDFPLVRLESGKHVSAFFAGMPQAFFPSNIETGFPTIRRSVCASLDATKYLQSLGLTTPDPVDDVIRNLLPIYDAGDAKRETYAVDLARILGAFKTDSNAQKQKLVAALKDTPFILAKEMSSGEVSFETPQNTSIATARLRELYDGIEGVYLTDENSALRGEPMRELLEACGATRYIYPVEVRSSLTDKQKYNLRLSGGQVRATSEMPITDVSLRGLEEIFEQLPTFGIEARRTKARLIWEALVELQDRRGEGIFTGLYRWQYFQTWSTEFDSQFVRLLNQRSWIPDADGDLVPPSSILFEATGWPSHPFLQSKITFKKPIVEELAKEAGFEPGMLDILKKLGLTSTAELTARLNVDDLLPEQPPEVDQDEDEDSNGDDDDSRTPETDADQETADDEPDEDDESTDDDASDDYNDGDDEPSTRRTGTNGGGSSSGRSHSGAPSNGSQGGGSRSANNNGGGRKSGERKFVSYIATHPNDDDGDDDEDGLDHAQRMALEAKAIVLIQKREPRLKSTPAGNQGFVRQALP